MLSCKREASCQTQSKDYDGHNEYPYIEDLETSQVFVWRMKSTNQRPTSELRYQVHMLWTYSDNVVYKNYVIFLFSLHYYAAESH